MTTRFRQGRWLLICCLTLWGCKDSAPSSPPVPESEGDSTVVVEEPEATLPPESPLVMLTPTEYNYTVRDLYGFPDSFDEWPDAPPVAEEVLPPEAENIGIFGGQVIPSPPWPRAFPEEIGVHEFEGMADGQVPSAYGLEELQKAALKLAPYALVSPLFFTCSDWSEEESSEQKACAWASIERFTQRAWRRPIEDEESQRLEEFWEANWTTVTPEQAVVLTVAGVLQSPAFLFRIEEGVEGAAGTAARKLSGWELASKLSYFLWDSMPDQALFAAAAKGELDTVEGIETQARRLLADPRARSMMVHFHHQWLQTHEVLGISPARSAFGPLYGIAPYPALDTTDDGAWPGILGPVRHSLHVETSLFVEEAIFEGAGTFEELMTRDKGYRSNRTEPLYGDNVTVLEGDTVKHRFNQVIFSQGTTSTLTLEPIQFPPGERAGILTLPAVMAIGAYAVHPAPIIRGVRLLERVVCQSFGAPPPGVEASVPPDALEVESTNRERTETATSAPVCAGCHASINPPGFAFEHYDAMGRYQSEDNGLPVDATGSVALWSGETLTFEDGVQLGQQLAQSERALNCYTLHWVRYATGVDFVEGDEGLAELQEDFRGNDNIQDLLVSIAVSDVFRYRAVEGGAE